MSGGAFAEVGPVVGAEVDVEDVEFLVAVWDGAVRVDPDQGVGEAGGRWCGGFVDSDVDGYGVVVGEFLEALHEG